MPRSPSGGYRRHDTRALWRCRLMNDPPQATVGAQSYCLKGSIEIKGPDNNRELYIGARHVSCHYPTHAPNL